MDKLGKRLEQAINNSNKNLVELAEIIGISEKTIRNYKKDGNKIPSGNLLLLAKECDVSPEWLLTGKGEMLLQEQKTTPHEPSLSKEERELLLNFKELPPDLQEIHFLEIKTDALKEKRKQRSNNPLEAPTKTDATA